MRRVNPRRKKEKYARNFAGPFAEYNHADFIRGLPCLVTQADGNQSGLGADGEDLCYGKIEASHIRPRGMGGCGGSWEDLVPLCNYHHRTLDIAFANRVEKFSAYYGIDAEKWARLLVITVKTEREER